MNNLKKLTPYILFFFILIFVGCQSEETASQTNLPDNQEGFAQYGIPFDKVPKTSEIIMYEVNPLVFSPTRNLKGVTARLDQIKDLGVNVIWLMPIHPIGEEKGFGSPYAVKNFYDINPSYGTLEDLRNLVAEAHKRDMAVIMDLVANHTSWDNEWVIKNKSWYSQDHMGNIKMAENWSDVAELNYDKEALRTEMMKVMEYWVLEANVDGYRCDFADGVPLSFWKDAIKSLRDLPNRNIIMFAEAADKNMYSAGFDMIFGWGFYHGLKEVYQKNDPISKIFIANTNDYSNIPNGVEILRFVTNHDYNAWDEVPRTVFNGHQGVLAAYVITAYLGGVPMIYNGQEVGTPANIPFFRPTNFTINWSINSNLKAEYSKINKLKINSNALKNGVIQSFSNNSDIFAFTKSISNEQVLVIVNVRNQNIDFSLPSAIANSNWSNAFNGNQVSLGNRIQLSPYSYQILRR